MDQVILVHREAVHPAQVPLLRRNALEAVVAAPFMEIIGIGEVYPTLAQKAAHLAEGISRAQAFQDGNKRTAWLATLAFLEINGYTIDPATDQEEAAGWVLSLLGGCSTAAIRWLNDRMIRQH